jgi:hypothetical protein
VAVFGFFDGTRNTVWDVLEACPWSVTVGSGILITSYDGSPEDVPLLLPAFTERGIDARIVGDALFIADPLAGRAVILERDLLEEFSELYVVQQAPLACPPIAHYTSERVRFNELSDEDRSTIVRQMRELHACRYLSDGVGLNYVCESEDVEQRLLQTLRRVPRP